GLLLLVTTVAPALVLGSERKLEDARAAQRAGNCPRTVDRATASIESLSVRPEPYELIAICQANAGRVGFAIRAIQKAVDHDPDNWRYHYNLAILRGGIGLDPRPELETAHRLNPHDPEVTALLASVPRGTAVNWELEL